MGLAQHQLRPVGGYRNAGGTGRALVKNKGGHGSEEKTIHFTQSVDRHLLNYIQAERAKYDPYGRKRLGELDDSDPLFLTRTGKPYSRTAFYYHWNRLFFPAQQQLQQQEQVEFTPHDLRHLRVTRAVMQLRKEANGDAAVEAELLEGFQQLMGWRSPETMKTYLKTMNQRKAIETILADEEAQEQSDGNLPEPILAKLLQESPSMQEMVQDSNESSVALSGDDFSWYEDE